MGTITLNVDDEVEREFRTLVNELYSKKKGSLGNAVTEAIKAWIRDKKQAEIAQEGLKLLNQGFYMGEKLYKSRRELHER